MPDDILKRILLVEDEPDIQAVAKMALECVGGYNVEVCSSGREALEKAPVFQPDVVLMDVMMPGMNGVETLRRLQQLDTVPIPVIFMTAKVQSQEMLDYRQLGAIGVIGKPFDPVELSTQVHALYQAGHKGCT